MFDPTAFENMKVVLEGAMYDKEFNGEAFVTNRSDIVNLSNLSRQYEIEIALNEKHSLKANILLEADIENLASEIIGYSKRGNSATPGCAVAVSFILPYEFDKQEADQLIDSLEAIWGKKRIITVSSTIQFSNGEITPAPSSRASVLFGRLITEEQMEDLLIMANYMADSLSMIDKLHNKQK